MSTEARLEATKQWNARACGELPGDKSTKSYFESVEFDRYRQQGWQHAYYRFDEFRGKDVLEIGVGQGTDLLQFAKGGARCHAVDITDNHLMLASRNFELNGQVVDLRKCDATQLPFADESIDCVYSFGVIHHIPESEAVLAEVHRVLRPGGMVMLALYYKWSAFAVFSKVLWEGILQAGFLKKGYRGVMATIESGADGVDIKPYVRLYSKRSVRELLRQFAIEDVSVHQLYPDHFSRLLSWLVPVSLARAFDRKMGWYVTARATKAPVAERGG